MCKGRDTHGERWGRAGSGSAALPAGTRARGKWKRKGTPHEPFPCPGGAGGASPPFPAGPAGLCSGHTCPESPGPSPGAGAEPGRSLLLFDGLWMDQPAQLPWGLPGQDCEGGSPAPQEDENPVCQATRRRRDLQDRLELWEVRFSCWRRGSAFPQYPAVPSWLPRADFSPPRPGFAVRGVRFDQGWGDLRGKGRLVSSGLGGGLCSLQGKSFSYRSPFIREQEYVWAEILINARSAADRSAAAPGLLSNGAAEFGHSPSLQGQDCLCPALPSLPMAPCRVPSGTSPWRVPMTQGTPFGMEQGGHAPSPELGHPQTPGECFWGVGEVLPG